MPRTTKAERLAKARESAAFRVACNGVPIPMLELSAVFQTARDAIARGATDAETVAALRDYVAARGWTPML
jgi:hypothetical protein